MDCRRELVLSYFGEKFDKSECNRTCDNCKNNLTAEMRDISGIIQDLLLMIQEMGHQQATIAKCIDTYRGLKSAKILESNFNNLDGYGKGILIILHFLIPRTL